MKNMKTRENDFIEIDYVARLKENNKIFDLTDKKVAEDNKLHQKGKVYHPIVICLGHNDVIPGLDKELINKDLGEYKLEVTSKDAFGRRNADLIKLLPTSIFLKQNMKPIPGLHVNLDGIYGVILSVSGGRTIVDFNHPLSGKDLLYQVKILKFIENIEEKIKSILDLVKKDVKFTLKDDNLVVNLKLNEKQEEDLIKEIKSRIPKIKDIKFEKTTTPE